MGGWSSKREGEPQEILRDWLAEDFVALETEEPTQMANRCFQCEEWYCADHLRYERIVYGAQRTTTTSRASAREATNARSSEPEQLVLP